MGGEKPEGVLKFLNLIKITRALCFASLREQPDDCASCQQTGMVNILSTIDFIFSSELLQGGNDAFTVFFFKSISRIIKWSSGNWASGYLRVLKRVFYEMDRVEQKEVETSCCSWLG